MEDLSTKEKFMHIGKQEFLDKGFTDASLREICKKAGFTLGAFYGYYPNKEALFEELVKEPAEDLFELFSSIQKNFSALPAKKQEQEMTDISVKGLRHMIEFLYQNFEIYRILLLGSAGTKYETFGEKFVALETESTYAYIEILRSQGHEIQIDDDLIHIIISGKGKALLEILYHDMPLEKALEYAAQMHSFYAAGWNKLFGV